MNGACIYQTVHILDGHPLHLADHVGVLCNASRALFGRPFHTATDELTQRITAFATSQLQTERSVFIRLILTSEGDVNIEFSGTSLYRGYALRSLTPEAVSLRYDIPFGDYPTPARDALAALARIQAERQHARCTVRCNNEGIVLTGDDAPLFAVRGTAVFMSPSVWSVERSVAASCIEAAGLTLTEQPVMQENLPHFEELFYFDHRGITTLARCDGHPYMALMTERIARAAEKLYGHPETK